MILTTNAAIYVSYREELSTVISFKDETTIHQEGVEVLKQYAVSDRDYANDRIDKYKKLACEYITYIPQASNSTNTANDYQLQISNNSSDNLNIEIEQANN